MATQPDFWGDIEVSEVRTPAAILREQAALLGAKTQHKIEAVVNTRVSGSYFFHSFNLVAPVLDDYTYELLKVRHELDLYPVTVEQPSWNVLIPRQLSSSGFDSYSRLPTREKLLEIFSRK